MDQFAKIIRVVKTDPHPQEQIECIVVEGKELERVDDAAATEDAAPDLPDAVREEYQQGQAEHIERREAQERSHPGSKRDARLEQQECAEHDLADEDRRDAEIGERSRHAEVAGEKKAGDSRPNDHGDPVNSDASLDIDKAFERALPRGTAMERSALCTEWHYARGAAAGNSSEMTTSGRGRRDGEASTGLANRDRMFVERAAADILCLSCGTPRTYRRCPRRPPPSAGRTPICSSRSLFVFPRPAIWGCGRSQPACRAGADQSPRDGLPSLGLGAAGGQLLPLRP